MSQRQTTRAASAVVTPRLRDEDLYLFNEGTHTHLWERLGSHPAPDGGTSFAVWAPNAREVSVVGDFNGWNRDAALLSPRGSSGIWEGRLPDIGKGTLYKYRITAQNGYEVQKADPFAVHHEAPPKTASVVWDLDYTWSDQAWMADRAGRNVLDGPMSVYEVHLGSWMRSPDNPDQFLGYRDVAPLLADYVTRTGFTHVELLPIMEHPFTGSWGYQTTGFFAPTSRFGTPQDFMYLVDHLHQKGIGIILDWVPSHFPEDEHGLGFFDGTHLFEHADPKQGFHPDWKSLIFNYGRNEVRSFLLSSALYWLGVHHIDGLRVDAVASMLYLDYSRSEGEWVPNEWGGRENLEAIGFLRRLNEDVYRAQPGVQTIAEESTAWPMVSRPTYVGGLGFGLKWDMGWMHDTLSYMQHEPIHRRFHQNELTFRSLYAFTESFMLPLSHDEVVHGKGSLIGKMPGDAWQQFANLRLLLAYQWAQSGKKLLFMGGEFGQGREWNHDVSLDWHQLEDPQHAGVHAFTSELNRLYRERPALHALDLVPDGFEWVDANDTEASVITFMRMSPHWEDVVLCAFNFTPVVRHNYRVGVPRGGHWEEILNSDAPHFGGSGQGNFGGLDASPIAHHGRPRSLVATLPPLATVWFRSIPGTG